MSWCDKLASVPGAGFGLETHFASSSTVLSALTPILDPLFDKLKPQFNIVQQQPFDVQLATNEGFNYEVDPTKIAVTFKHRMRARAVSGGPPIMEMLSRPEPFTKLLPIVSKRLVDATLLLPGPKTRSVTRVGIVSTSTVGDDELPPGIARFIEYIGRPWKAGADYFSISITSDVATGRGWTDRCTHQMTKPEDPEQLMVLNFDFQRTFTTGHPMNRETLTDLRNKTERDALRYFEDIGEGKRFDEDLIRETARA